MTAAEIQITRPRTIGSSAGAPRRSSGGLRGRRRGGARGAPRRRPPPRDRADRAAAARPSSRSASCSRPQGSPCSARRAGSRVGQNRCGRDRSARLDPVARTRGDDRPRPADDPHVRADAAGRDPACVWLTAVRWRRLGGDSDLVMRVAVWGVAAGVVGARAYHDITSWSEVPDPKWKGIFEVWKGGLGVWGGILLGDARRRVVVRRVGQRRARCSWTRPRRACCSRRASAGSATGGTRSSSASRPTCRGASRSTAHRTAPERVPRRDDVPPDVPLRADLGPRRRRAADLDRPALSGSGRRRSSRSTSPTTASGASSRSCCASTRRTSSSALRLNAWVSIVVFICSTAFFIWWQVLGRGGERDRAAQRPRGRPPARRRRRGRRWPSRRAASGRRG